jgi:flagellin-like protein
MSKKAEMGVGTLIIFIAMLLVAAVAAGVLLQTAGSLQERALSTGQQARSQISTNAETIEVSATDGRDGNLTDFSQYMKLSPGSDPVKLDQIIFTFNTKDNTATLKYRGADSICAQNNVDGYNTLDVEVITTAVNTTVNNYQLEDDFDDDGAADYLYVYNSTTLAMNLSSNGTIFVNLDSGLFNTTTSNVVMTSKTIANGSTIYATIDLDAVITVANNIPATGYFRITPYRLGEGYFSVVYEQQGTNWVNGNLQRGDVIKLCFESPRDVTEDEEVRLNFIPKIGTATLTQFVTPDVISTERVYLYP